MNTAIEIVAKRYSGTWTKGKRPTDCYLKVAETRIQRTRYEPAQIIGTESPLPAK